jgi:hypothetical protein
MTYLVDVGSGSDNYYGWEDYKGLKRLCEYFDSQCELYETTDGEEGVDRRDYQSDSPYAEFISGYNTDSFADDSISIIQDTWEEYVDECEDEEKTPSWDDCWDNYIWESTEYQLCHTWLRVTNIHNEKDEDIKTFAKDCDFNTMSEKLGLATS